MIRFAIKNIETHKNSNKNAEIKKIHIKIFLI